jgi:hypothetical protein
MCVNVANLSPIAGLHDGERLKQPAAGETAKVQLEGRNLHSFL